VIDSCYNSNDKNKTKITRQ